MSLMRKKSSKNNAKMCNSTKPEIPICQNNLHLSPLPNFSHFATSYHSVATMFRFGWLHLLFSTLWLFNSIQNVSSITSEGFRVEHGSSPILGNYVFAQNIKNSKIIRGK